MCNEMKTEQTPEEQPPELDEALLISGQLVGYAMRLNEEVLEKWLDTNLEGFRHVKFCRAAVNFKKETIAVIAATRQEVFKPNENDPS